MRPPSRTPTKAKGRIPVPYKSYEFRQRLSEHDPETTERMLGNIGICRCMRGARVGHDTQSVQAHMKKMAFG
jgi:hypothetical protein